MDLNSLLSLICEGSLHCEKYLKLWSHKKMKNVFVDFLKKMKIS